MPEQIFNEAEQFLLQNWATTEEVEDSIEQVREKYQKLCDGIAEAVQENHKEFDYAYAQVTQRSGASRSRGVIFIGCRSWPSYGKNNPTGFWIENLRLEVLADPDEDPPTLGFWLCLPEDEDDDDYTEPEEVIQQAARKALMSEQSTRWHLGDNEETALVGRVIASKQEVLDILSKSEAKRFVDMIVDQLEELVALVPAIEDAIKNKRKRN